MVVGKAHIEHSQIQIDPKNSLKTFFKNAQIPTIAINLVYTGKNVYADNYDQQWKWNICNENPPLPLDALGAVKRDRLNSHGSLVVIPIITYDYFLFLPEVEKKRLYAN